MKISFCIATYKRPNRLKLVLDAISNQESLENLEVVVSDNDPDGSAQNICQHKSYAALAINYVTNETNLGMVGNFNRSLSRATGDYIVFNTDDDLPMPSLTRTLRFLHGRFAGYGCYFGAAGTYVESVAEASLLRKKVGLNSQLAARPENSVAEYPAEHFLHEFFDGTILPYFLWSTGMVRQDIARSIGGMPDYGSPYFTDFCYLALAGERKGMVVQNTLLGYQTIHPGNFGKGANDSLANGVLKAYRYLGDHLPPNVQTIDLQKKIDRFFGWWSISQLVWMKKVAKNDPPLRATIAAQVEQFRRLDFFKPLYPRYLARAYFPWIGRTLQAIRKLKREDLSKRR